MAAAHHVGAQALAAGAELLVGGARVAVEALDVAVDRGDHLGRLGAGLLRLSAQALGVDVLVGAQRDGRLARVPELVHLPGGRFAWPLKVGANCLLQVHWRWCWRLCAWAWLLGHEGQRAQVLQEAVL